MEQACIHIYCGDGKGKTSAAVGLAIRAAGADQKVLIARFMKTEDSGEVRMLRKLPGITVLPCEKIFGFYSQMTPEQKTEAAGYYGELLERVFARATKEQVDVLILDEIIASCNYQLVDEERLLKLLKARPKTLEVVMTGRNPSDKLICQADYLSEIMMRKHPYERGLMARSGIEF